MGWAGFALAGSRETAAEMVRALSDPGRLGPFVAANFSAEALTDFPVSAWARSLSVAAQESGGLVDWSLGGDAADVTIAGRARAAGVPLVGHVWFHGDKIKGFQLTRDVLARGPDAPVWPECPGDDAAIAAAVDREVAWRDTNDRFGGVVLLAHGDRILVDRAVGWADAVHGRRNQPGDRFALASLTKMFTAVAVAQLVEAGTISLDDPIARWLPTYPDPALARQITPRQLLGHTAGLGELSLNAPGVWQDFERGAGPGEMLKHLADVPQESTPGTGYLYSNAGFLVLGALIEAVSGERYADRIQSHVFDPAGMANALFPEPGRRPARSAEGLTYASDDPIGLGLRVGNGGRVPVFSGPAAGTYATAADLFHFMRALHDGRIIKPETLKLFTAGRSRTWDGIGRYGLGFTERNGHMFGHAGGAGAAGINDVVWSSNDGAWTVVVLSNLDAPAGVDLGTGIMDFLLGVPAH